MILEGLASLLIVHAPGDAPELRELLPGVRVAEGTVEFRGTVCADTSHPQTPVVYLELLVTAPDSREHESLVVTTVKPSAIHAGMLAAGLEPGQPLRIEQERRIAPTGDAVRVEVATVLDDVPGPFNLLSDWVIRVEPDAQTSAPERLSSAPGWGLVFAGSRVDGRGYAADNTGTIVGLTGFGTEVIGASWTLSPWAAEDEPVWIVDAERIADYGTEVIVRISTGADNSRRADDPADPAGPSVVDDPDAARPRPER